MITAALPTTEQEPCVASDGAGGCFIAWMDNRAGSFDIYAQHIDANGTLHHALVRASHHAMGVPTKSRISVTMPARRTVSQMACQSLSVSSMPSRLNAHAGMS